MHFDQEVRRQRKLRKLRTRWRRRAQWLDCYKHRCSPAASRLFYCREGYWVLLVMVLHPTTASVVATQPWYWWGVGAALGSGLLLFDTLAANTAIVFGEDQAVHPLRSVVLTMGAYFNVALSFAPVWMHLESSKAPWCERVITAVYPSVRTLSTVGPDATPGPTWGKFLIVGELLVGVYFLATVLAIYVNRAAGNRERRHQ